MAPPRELVVTGAYRHVRNPMYVATAAVIVGEGLLLRQPILLVAAAVYCRRARDAGPRASRSRCCAAASAPAYDAYRDAVPGLAAADPALARVSTAASGRSPC